MEKDLSTSSRDWMRLPVGVSEIPVRSDYHLAPQSGSILDHWRALSRRKLLLCAFALAGVLLGLGFTLLQSPSYRADATLEIQDVKDDIVAMKILNPLPDAAPSDALTDIQTQIKIMQSRSLIERALQQAHITSRRDLLAEPGNHDAWRRVIAGATDGGVEDGLVEEAAKHLKVNAAGQTRIVEVSFDAADPKVAARFTNALASEYIAQNLEARFQMNRQTSEWLVGQLDELREKLQQSEDSLQSYARQQGLLYTSDNQIISQQKLRQLQDELSTAQADRVAKESRFEVAQNASADTVPDVLNDGNLGSLETTLTDLKRRDAEMGVTFRPEYASSKKLQAEIDTLEAAITAKRAAIMARIDNELQESKRREQLLSAAYVRQTRLVINDSEKSIQYEMLKHDVDTNRQVYESMLQRVKESSIATAMKATNVRIIDAANAPLHPFKPSLAANAGVGLFGGLLVGILGVLVQTRLDSRVQDPGDASLLLGIPELGVIPAAKSLGERGSSPFTLYPADPDPESLNMQFIPGANTSAAVADSFRAVLTSIIFGSPKERPKVLVVTSSSPGEGKTTMAANLAVTLAKMNRRVLLIDGDIRSPRLQDIFGLGNSVGLTHLLKQPVLEEKVADGTVRQTALKGLRVLTSGPALHADADLLFSRSMPWLIAHYRDQYDMVLIDTPPALSMPDARLLGRMADAVILIARSGRTTRDAIHATFRRFVEDHTRVLGIVLNDWNAKSSRYQYYSAYNVSTEEPASAKAASAV